MSFEWDSLILGGNELKTVVLATENARRTGVYYNDKRSILCEHIALVTDS